MDWVETHYQSIAALIGFVAWLSRLESKVRVSEKRIDHIDHCIESIEDGMMKELSEVKQSLARIEGYLKAKSEGINGQ